MRHGLFHALVLAGAIVGFIVTVVVAFIYWGPK